MEYEYDIQIEYPMQILYIAKAFYDHGKLDNLLDCFPHDPALAWDELGWIEQASIRSVFSDTRFYYQKGRRVGEDLYLSERDTYVMRDPLLTQYDALCRKLEMTLGITKIENQFVRDLESAVHRNLQFGSYSYDYHWIDSTQDKKGAKIVLSIFEEFCAYYDIPDSLFTILDFCEAGIPRLEAALAEASKEKVIPLPIKSTPEKEAA